MPLGWSRAVCAGLSHRGAVPSGIPHLAVTMEEALQQRTYRDGIGGVKLAFG
jgi:hypothetical protein